MSSSDFWTLSPTRFWLILKEHEKARRQVAEETQRAAALVASMIVNKNMMSKPRRFVKPSEFMPKASGSAAGADRTQSTEEQLGVVRAWVSSLSA